MIRKRIPALVLAAVPGLLMSGMALVAAAQTEGKGAVGTEPETAGQSMSSSGSIGQGLPDYGMGPGTGTMGRGPMFGPSPFDMAQGGQWPGMMGAPGPEGQGMGFPPFGMPQAGQPPGMMGGPGMRGSPGMLGGPEMMGAPGPGSQSMGPAGGFPAFGGPQAGQQPGMMGGPGMTGGVPDILGPLFNLNLSDVQREQLVNISDKLRKKLWGLTGKMMDYNSEMRRLLSEQKRLDQAINTLRSQMMQAAEEAKNRAQGVLSENQRRQLEQMMSPGWW